MTPAQLRRLPEACEHELARPLLVPSPMPDCWSVSRSLVALLGGLFLSDPAWAAPPRWQSSAPGSEREKTPDGCRESATGEPGLDAALRALVFQLAEEKRPLAGVRLEGLGTLKEDILWEAIGGRPATWDAARAAILLRRLVGLGIFEQVSPVVELGPDSGPTLVVTLVEHPTVRRVVVEGLSELAPEGLLEEMLETPSREEVERRRIRIQAAVETDAEGDDPAKGEDNDAHRDGHDEALERDLSRLGPGPRKALRTLRRIFDRNRQDGFRRCPDPLPPRQWLARADEETVFPGIVWKGLPPALGRVQRRLRQRGYQLSRLEAELTADGTLTVRIDEGRTTGLEIRGVAPRLEPRVRALLGVEPGKPLVDADIEEGLDRIRAAYPFLRPHDQQLASRAEPALEELPAADGIHRYRSKERRPETGSRWYTLADGKLVVYFRARRGATETHVEELLRHTPVTSFAPGLEASARIWDPENRAHLGLELGANVNTHRAEEIPPDTQRWRFDGRVSPKVQIPDLGIAELGLEAHSLVDTADRWRISPIDSYFYSILLNRPDSEYFHREGLAAFITFHLLERLTAGVEYRRDRYRSLVSAPDIFTLFRRQETTPVTPAITPGRMGSLLVRVEYSTQAVPLHRVSPRRRDPERSILGARGDHFWTGLRTVNTVEIADPALGGDDGFEFVRLVSDSTAFFRTSGDSGLKVRGRAAGRIGSGEIPSQKREALGGWSALRGYDFKELAGDFSLLGTAEYRMDGLSLFVDAGSVRNDGAFGPVRTGVGAALNFDDDARLDFAWRTDDEAGLRPEIRLFLQRTF
jgi:hypothetical protein